jgi:hypothetical protein
MDSLVSFDQGPQIFNGSVGTISIYDFDLESLPIQQ